LINIKRDPKCDTNATFEQKLTYFDKIRATGKELIDEKEYSNARTLYSRCISYFKNMPKKQKESLTEEEKVKKDEILNILYLNVALCFLKKAMYKDCIKNA